MCDYEKILEEDKNINDDNLNDLEESNISNKIEISTKNNFNNYKEIIVSGIILGLVAGVIFLFVSYLGEYYINKKFNSIGPVTTYTYVSENESSSNSSIIEEAMKSIVSINTKQQINYQFYGYDSSYEVEGAGSGVIIGKSNDEIIIITNNHVISDADSINISFCDGTFVEGNIKGGNSSADLAIVAVSIEKIEKSTLDNIRIAVIGDSDNIKVGDDVIAIGNALGYGQSVTKGIVSALDKSVKNSDGEEMIGLIQTDAAINPGNSGGALLNSKGELIGINVSKYAGDKIEGIGFAIPISSSNDVINDLMNRKTKNIVSEDKRGYLQITVSNVSEEANIIYNIPKGVFVQDVIKDGAADKAGIQSGDVIIELNGTSISAYDDLKKELSYYESGEKINVIVKSYINGEWIEKDIIVNLNSKN